MKCVYGWVGIAGSHQLNSCQNFNLLKQINNKQTLCPCVNLRLSGLVFNWIGAKPLKTPQIGRCKSMIGPDRTGSDWIGLTKLGPDQ